MVELVYGTVLGALAAGLFTLYLRSKSLSRQLDALRAEVAMARIEGVLADGGDGPPPEVVRRKRHLGLVRRTGALAGLALGSVGWVRSHHRIASTGAAATVAVVAVGAVYIGGPEPRRSEPAPPGPMPEAVLSPTLSPYEPAPSSTPPSTGPRPRSSRTPAAPSTSTTAGTVADITDLVSLLPVAPVAVPSVLSVPSVDASLAATPSQSLPCVRATLGPAEAEACVTG